MKKLQTGAVFTLLLFLLRGFTLPGAGLANEITGVYWSPKRDAKIEIYMREQMFYGRSIWVAKPGKDVNNPSSKLQTRDLLGIELLTHFKYDSGSYTGGEIYDPASGKTYSCKMVLEGNRLKVRGFIGISLFGRTEYFERIK